MTLAFSFGAACAPIFVASRRLDDLADIGLAARKDEFSRRSRRPRARA